METRKILGTIVGVLAFIALIAGLTYAWFTWQSGNTILSGDTDCFTIVYQGGQAVSEEITPSADYTGGKALPVTISIDPECTIGGTATIKFTVNGSATANLLSSGAMKYAVYQGTTPVNGGTGVLNATGTHDLVSVPLTTTATAYTVYIWADGSIINNDLMNSTFSGYIHAYAEQAHE